jgi:hypothetical protein
MRIHPFALVKVQGNYPTPDLEYISDYHENGGKRLFQQVCQLDNHTEMALVAGALAGYQEGKYGKVDISLNLDQEDWTCPNKGYIALWAEHEYKGDDIVVVVWGIYRHDSKVYLIKSLARDLIKYSGINQTYWSDRLHMGLIELNKH